MKQQHGFIVIAASAAAKRRATDEEDNEAEAEDEVGVRSCSRLSRTIRGGGSNGSGARG